MRKVTFGLCIVIQLLFSASHGSAGVKEHGNPFVGRWQWDGANTCAAKYDGEDVAIEIRPAEIVFYENLCRITSSRRLGDGSVGDISFRFNLVCKGEGSVEKNSTIFSLVKKSKIHEEQLVRLEIGTGFTQIYQRCF